MAFCARFGKFEFLVILFGLAPTSFMTLIDKVLKPYLGKFIVMFLDNIIVYSCSKEEYWEHIHLGFQFLDEKVSFAKQSKWESFQ